MVTRRAAALAVISTLAGVLGVPSPAWSHPAGAADAYRWVATPGWSSQVQSAEGRQEVVDPELINAGAATVWTPDFQAVVTVGVDRHVSSPATVTVTPLDPSPLPRPPGGLPNGNAYHVRVEAVGWEPASVQVGLATPFEATGLVALRGESWDPLPMQAGAVHVTASVPPDVVVLAIASRTDGHDGWWDAFLHDPWRVSLLVVAILAVLGRWWRVRHQPARSSTPAVSRTRKPVRP